MNDVCFARHLTSEWGVKGKVGIIKSWMYVNQHKRAGANLKEAMAFWNWIMKRSPWRDAFLNKRPSDMLKRGVYFDCNQEHRLINGAMAAIREAWEFHSSVSLWYKLVKMGLEEHIAHIICHSFTFKNGQLREYKHNNHRSIDGHNIDIKRYKGNDPFFVGGKRILKEDAKDYHYIHAMFNVASRRASWNQGKEGQVYKFLKGRFAEIPGKGWDDAVCYIHLDKQLIKDLNKEFANV
jgi:hypothetical protein